MRLPRLSIVAFALVALFCLPSLVYTGSYIVSDAPIPMEGVEPSPYPNEPLTEGFLFVVLDGCLLYTSPSPRDATLSRMPSSA